GGRGSDEVMLGTGWQWRSGRVEAVEMASMVEMVLAVGG
nr:hypothetical protein [Tanacetum cinerariifolium]